MWSARGGTKVPAETIALVTVTQVHGDFGFKFDGVDDPDQSHRLTDLNLGGGATLDIGVYPISCLLLAFGTAPPTSLGEWHCACHHR